MRPRLRIEPSGRTANQLLQYIFAVNIQRQVEDLEIYGYNLPEWNLVSPTSEMSAPDEIKLGGNHLFCDDIVDILRKRLATSFFLKGLAFRLSNYAPPEYYKPILKAKNVSSEGYGDDCVVFHIRAGDILHSSHPDYFPIPFSYIDTVLKKSPLRPVFIGQLDDNYYTQALHKKYPDAIFSPPQSPIEDFETIRRSKQIAISISSFSWVAAWLSDATRIHVPVAGMLNPLQRPDIDLLPIDDDRYVFYHFEPFDWKATPEHIQRLWEDREHPLLDRSALLVRKQVALRRILMERQWARLKLYSRAHLKAFRSRNQASRTETV